MLRSSNAEILRNVCGCLKNLAFGRDNDVNKRLINQKGGVKALAQLLRNVNTPPEVQEEATGALWNISSADDLKESVLNQAAETVVTHVVCVKGRGGGCKLGKEGEGVGGGLEVRCVQNII